jgi:hypothetical protein
MILRKLSIRLPSLISEFLGATLDPSCLKNQVNTLKRARVSRTLPRGCGSATLKTWSSLETLGSPRVRWSRRTSLGVGSVAQDRCSGKGLASDPTRRGETIDGRSNPARRRRLLLTCRR